MKKAWILGFPKSSAHENTFIFNKQLVYKQLALLT